MPSLRIKRTLTVVTEVPYNDEHYPDMTIEEARRSELDMPDEEAAEFIVEAITWAPNLHFDVEVDVLD